MKVFGKYWRVRSIRFEFILNSITAVALIFFLSHIFSLLLDYPLNIWWHYLALSPQKWYFRPWTLVTYAWIHTDFIGFLINLMLVYFIGKTFLTFDKEERLIRLFWTGILAGALGFLLMYALFPGIFPGGTLYLTGISTAYTAWLAYLTYRFGNYPVYIRLVGEVKLKYIFFLFLLLDLLYWPLGNHGGHIAHWSAMAAGFVYAFLLEFRSRREVARANIYDNYKTSSEKKLDKILDKINRSGINSLTEEEKAFLHRESKRKGS